MRRVPSRGWNAAPEFPEWNQSGGGSSTGPLSGRSKSGPVSGISVGAVGSFGSLGGTGVSGGVSPGLSAGWVAMFASLLLMLLQPVAERLGCMAGAGRLAHRFFACDAVAAGRNAAADPCATCSGATRGACPFPRVLIRARPLSFRLDLCGRGGMVDALVLGTSIERCGGSSPFARTITPPWGR